MPEVDGFAVLEWLREQPHADRFPVVVLTSSADPAAEDRSLSLGARAFYRKPDDLDSLGRIVRDIVQGYLGEELMAGSLGSVL
jgi:CheY-like chemotaxis protein